MKPTILKSAQKWRGKMKGSRKTKKKNLLLAVIIITCVWYTPKLVAGYQNEANVLANTKKPTIIK